MTNFESLILLFFLLRAFASLRLNQMLLSAALAIALGLFGVDALHAIEQLARIGALDAGCAGAAVIAARFGCRVSGQRTAHRFVGLKSLHQKSPSRTGLGAVRVLDCASGRAVSNAVARCKTKFRIFAFQCEIVRVANRDDKRNFLREQSLNELEPSATGELSA
jgi:hypothetical protein